MIAFSVVGRCWCDCLECDSSFVRAMVSVIASSVVGRCCCDCLECGRSFARAMVGVIALSVVGRLLEQWLELLSRVW